MVAGGTPAAITSILNSVEIFDPISNAWTFGTSLSMARANHTATLLPNGKVIVVGGGAPPDGLRSALGSAELYDPATNLWSNAASLRIARTQHTATLLYNGKVLVVGGAGGGYVSSAELYDPATDSWSIAGNLATPRRAHTATRLRGGSVLVAGGSGSGTSFDGIASAEIYDPATNSWRNVASMVTARQEHTATLLADGNVLVAGGIGGTTYPLNAELYDPSNNAWSSAGNLLFGRAGHSATLLQNAKVLLAGGSIAGLPVPFSSGNAELYDPATPGRPLTISQSWNLLGNSGGAALDVTSAFADATKVTSVWKWAASTKRWAFYSPQLVDGGVAYAAANGFDALTSINSGEGFWLNAKVPFPVSTPNGTILASAFQANLPSGWSLISIGEETSPSEFNWQLAITPPQPNIFPTNMTALWAWDSVQARWYFYAPSLSGNGTLSGFIQSRNYLDFEITFRALGPGIGFWVNMP